MVNPFTVPFWIVGIIAFLVGFDMSMLVDAL